MLREQLNKIRSYILPLFLVGTCSLQSVFGQEDVLTIDTLLHQAKLWHPMSKRASLKVLMADANILKAKGKFDPSIDANYAQKYFNGSDYYRLLDGSLKIPTLYGFDFKAGYEQNNGKYINNENLTPDNGLFYTGVAVPLLQGLMIDDRRAGLFTARLEKDAARFQESETINDLLYMACINYWEWFRTYHSTRIIQDAASNADMRLKAVKIAILNGDRPRIDSVEAAIQVQNLVIGWKQSRVELAKAQQSLISYFWESNYSGELRQDKLKPVSFEKEMNNQNIQVYNTNDEISIATNPYINQLKNKTLQLDVERKIKREKLKPKINLHYNFLTQNIGGDIISNFSINNYKWGIDFKYPLLLRNERGDIKLTELKLQDNKFALDQKENELRLKLKALQTEVAITAEQIDDMKNNVNNYKILLDAERQLFDNGESSLFLINSREQSYINSNLKLIELIAKNRIAQYSIQYIAGKLY